MLQAVDEMETRGTQVICIAPTRELARMLYNDTLYPLLRQNPAIRHRLVIPEDQNPKEGHIVYAFDHPSNKWEKGIVTKTYPHPAKDPVLDRVDIDAMKPDGTFLRKIAKKEVGLTDVHSATSYGGPPHIVVGTPGSTKHAIHDREL